MVSPRKNGYFELKFSEDGSQALATIYPPAKDGESVEYEEVVQRLKSMGVSYGIRDQAITDAVRQAGVSCQIASGVVVAQGILPKAGQDAKVRYAHSTEMLLTPLPKRKDGSGMVDWFNIPPAHLVKAGEELATIVPSQPGTPGKTITWPITVIPPRPGKPAALSAGMNVRTSEDGLRLFADQEGAIVLHGEQLVIHAHRQIKKSVENITLKFPTGAAFFADICNAQVFTETFIAVRGKVLGAYLRAHGDVLITSAQDSRIVATGNVYVLETLVNCDVTTPKKVIALGNATLVGGTIRGKEGVEAGCLGSENMTETFIETGVDCYSALRNQEIQEELAECQANINRISQALKPFTTLAAQSSLTDEKRGLLNKLQMQMRSQELTIKELHNERRQITIAGKERINSVVVARLIAYPGVWLRIGIGETLLETSIEAARFVQAKTGKTINMEALQAAA